MTPRRWTLLVAIAALALALGHLRDPPWLGRVEAGFREWEVDVSGTRFRWMGGHASFFVASDAAFVTIPLRTTFQPGDWPIVITVSIDDRLSDRVELVDDTWRTIRLKLPPQGNRRMRRIDVRANRVRAGNRSAQIGEVVVER